MARNWITMNLRLPQEMHAKIREAANAGLRPVSVNQEIYARLVRSFERDEEQMAGILEHFREHFDELIATVHANVKREVMAELAAEREKAEAA